jgi:ATP-dependent protease ClpP protease subunit
MLKETHLRLLRNLTVFADYQAAVASFETEEAKEIQKFKKELYTIISNHSHTPFEKVWNDSDRNYWMTAEEAREYGMIDSVLTRKK